MAFSSKFISLNLLFMVRVKFVKMFVFPAKILDVAVPIYFEALRVSSVISISSEQSLVSIFL